jgi:hypothetical protein
MARSANPRDIFNRLVKPSYMRDLLPGQIEVLDGWWRQRGERDNIIKQNTGGGKTLVGILIAESTKIEIGGNVLYLCPNKQLVEQTIWNAAELGIVAEEFVPGAGVKLPPRFISGEAMLVASYAALFNGRSKFGAQGGTGYVNLAALILDDAHVELSALRDAFTVVISATADKTKALYQRLAELFAPGFEEAGRGMTFEGVVEGKEWSVLEVPYWRWYELIPQVADLVKDVDELTWPLIRDDLYNCYCLIGPRSVSIVPILPPVDLLRSFQTAPRRIFMSATLTDDSVLAATFALSREVVQRSISTTSLASVGERMILVPGFRAGLEEQAVRASVKAVMQEVCDRHLGAVVLAPSKEASKEWSDVAHVIDESDAVAEAVVKMKAGNDRTPLALANRYDGIDLAGDACRLLILDGKPQGRSDYETYRASVLIDSGEIASFMAQRIEQGLGRGSRGGGDYCAVVLLGDDLVEWLCRHDNWKYMTASTRAQISIGEVTSQHLEGLDDLISCVWQCVDRNPDWVQYHQTELFNRIDREQPPAPSDSPMLLERKAYEKARLREYNAASTLLSDAADAQKPELPRDYKAWFLQNAARYAWLDEDHDKAVQLQKRAYAMNRSLLRPPMSGDPYLATTGPQYDQASMLLRCIDEYRKPAAYSQHVYSLLRPLVLPNTSYARFEQSLKDLGDILGFYAERPDNGKRPRKGPDVLWLAGELEAFVIEAKNEKGDEGVFSKSDHGQLLQSCVWFESHYPGWTYDAVVALPEARITESVEIGVVLALDANSLGMLVDDASAAIRDIIALPKTPRRQVEAHAILEKYRLTPASLRTRFVEFTAVPDRSGEPVKMQF